MRSVSSSIGEQYGMRLAGNRLVSDDSSIENVSTGSSVTALVGLLALPDGSGAAPAFYPLRNTMIDARHTLSGDLGAAVISQKTSLDFYHSRVFATNDGVEVGTSGDPGNVNGTVSFFNSVISAGGSTTGLRSSIRKHQNWGVVSRHTDFKEVILAESGGFLACLASTRSGGGDTFIANGCPLP